jgi:hypothetical protein
MFVREDQSKSATEFPPLALLLLAPDSDDLKSPKLQNHYNEHAYDSVVILALALVTFTPSCLARATMSMRLRAETAWEILWLCMLVTRNKDGLGCEKKKVLGSIGRIDCIKGTCRRTQRRRCGCA